MRKRPNYEWSKIDSSMNRQLSFPNTVQSHSSFPMTSSFLPTVNVPGVLQSGSDEEDSLTSLFPQLTYKERLIGFACCYALGILISVSSFGSFGELLAGDPTRFAILYSLGNTTSLCSTLFLVGFKRQLANMTKDHRRVSAAVYVSCMIATPLVAYSVPDMTTIILLLVLVQWMAFTWYSLSYIPFGRSIVTNLGRRLLPT